MDEADKAQELEEMLRRIAISKRNFVGAHDGYCLNCGEESAGSYCNRECREDAERFDKAAARNGR